jgi:serine/threonine protein kinase
MTPDVPTATATADDDAPSGDASDDPRLMSAMREYMAALDAGQRVNRRELIARHPDIAAELSACLQGLSFIQGAAGQLSDGAEPSIPRGRASAGDAPGINGTPLGDFRLLREIGRGGMGVVYEAVQLSLGRQVAVKVLPMAAALDPRRLQRFRNEAQAAAGLHHTNIVPVYAVGCDRSTHFYAMQLIEGRSLAEVIRELRAAEVAGGGGRRSLLARRLLDRPDAPTPASAANAIAGTAADVTQDLRPPPAGASAGSAGGSVAVPSTAWSGPRGTDSLSTLHVGRRSEYFRTVARLGVQAAEALDYAHGLGIVHRDVKPANLMIDGRGTLWVTDFGLAQMYGDNGLTQTGDFVGTFRYMSPEQAGGGPGRLGLGRAHRRRDEEARGSDDDDSLAPVVLDPRTDVYSLGVTLYELLTLQPALPGRTREELMYQLSSVDPTPPRAIDRSIPVELQTILAKAAAKDPGDRYPTAHALADDLRRFLADEPIHARPPTVWDRAVKWTRRHRSLALSAIVILTLAAAGLLVTTLVVSVEKRRTEVAYYLSTQQAREARDARNQAQADSKLARTTVDALARVAIDDVPGNPHTAAVRRLMLDTVLDYYKKFIEARGHDATASDPDLLAAQQRWKDTLDVLVATDEKYRVRFNIRLLARPDVRQDLHLTLSQSLDAENLADGVRGHGGAPDSGADGGVDGGPADGPGAEPAGPANGGESAEAMRGSLALILTPAQVVRLEQISRQLRGLLAFDDPEVQARLQLDREQKDFINKLRAAGPGGPRDGDGGPGGGPPFDDLDVVGGGPGGPGGHRGLGRPGWPWQSRADQARAVGRVVDILTARQRDDWQALIGPPFRDDATPGFGRPPRD